MADNYITVKGDSLQGIAYKKYGDRTKGVLIQEINPGLKYVGDFITTSAVLVTGQSLIIPEQVDPTPATSATEKKKVSLFSNVPSTIGADDPDEVAMLINGLLFRAFDNLVMKFDYDKLANEFSFISEFNPDIDEYRTAFKPKYQPTAIYIGGSLVIDGQSGAVPTLDPSKNAVNVKGYGNPGVLTKSAIVAPFEFDEGSTFTDIITNIAGRFGLIVVIDPLAAELSAKPFEKRIQFSPSEKVGGKLISMTKERGIVLSSTFNGRVLVTVPNTSLATVQAFVSGELPVVDFNPNFNPDALDTSYIGYAPGSPDEATEAGIVTVDGYPQPGILPRIKGITPSEADNQTLEDALRAERGRAFGEWMSPRLTVEGWRDKNGNLYTPNSIVTVKAPGVMIYEDTKFFVRAVTMRKSSNRKGAVLDLILPEAFTGRDLTIVV